MRLIPVLATLALTLFIRPFAATPEHLTADQLVNVESNLLSLFGLRRRPKVDRSKVVIPPAMMELYRAQTGLKLDTAAFHLPGKHTGSANTARTFTHVESKIDETFRRPHRFRLSFDLKTIPENERLTGAELHLTRIPLPVPEENPERHFQRIVVHDIVRPGVKGQSEPITRVIDSKLVNVSKSDILQLDVLPAVERWVRNPKSNHGVLVEVSDSDGPRRHVRLRRSLDEESANWSSLQPVLFTYTDDGKYPRRNAEEMARRSKRAPNFRRHKKKDTKNCQRHPLYVDFASVGWNDWIVAPPGYDAFYCQGNCPFPLADHLNSTNHAIVQTLVNSMNPNLAPKACCVPTELTSISMLYLDEKEKVVLKIYQDMAVLGCGCR